MIDGLIFGGLILFVVTMILLFGIGVKNILPWVKSKEGKGAPASMILGITVIVVAGILVTLLTGLFTKSSAESVLDTK